MQLIDKKHVHIFVFSIAKSEPLDWDSISLCKESAPRMLDCLDNILQKWFHWPGKDENWLQHKSDAEFQEVHH